MKKTIQKLMAALLAVAMVCAMAIPAFAYHTKEDINKDHSFSAFQIFQGDVKGTKLSNATWGSHITDHDKFLTDLKADPTLGKLFNEAADVQDVLAVIGTWHDSDADSIAFARVVCKYLYPDANTKPTTDITGDNTLHFDEAGYYLIVDTTKYNPGDSYVAYNSFMLTVTQANWNVTVTPKVEKPSVKKEVFDNNDIGSTGDNNGWGSSADHAINEPFQFKLTATLPASDAHVYDYYDKYTVIFDDTLSAGITFDNLDTVVITQNGNNSDIAAEHYKLVKHDESSFSLGIDDVKTCVANLNLNAGATITVTYTAHLNDKAFVNIASGSTENKNSVQLHYSNNPRDTGSFWGSTPKSAPESEVYVYTYQLNNTKRAENENGALLKGAGFRLYSDIACNKEQEIKLKKNTDGTYSRYFGAEDGDEMFSDDKGQFNVKGLDAGNYYLKETSTPADYNPCDVTPVTIKANHTKENVDLNGSKLSTTIINNKAGGITLPSTGGIGTTLFYVIGGGLMVAAAVLLITKKRMENK